MKTYNHAISLNFEVESDNEFPTHEEILEQIKKLVNEVDNFTSIVEIFDTFNNKN